MQNCFSFFLIKSSLKITLVKADIGQKSQKDILLYVQEVLTHFMGLVCLFGTGLVQFTRFLLGGKG